MKTADRALMLDVLKQFRILLRAMDTHYRQVERRSRLGGAQLWALSEVSARGGITVGELAQKLAIQLSTASNLVRRLEKLGLVERTRSRADRRLVTVTATARGRRKLARAPRPSTGLLQEALLGLGVRELRTLRSQLARLLDRMDQADPRAASLPLGELLGRRRRT